MKIVFTLILLLILMSSCSSQIKNDNPTIISNNPKTNLTTPHNLINKTVPKPNHTFKDISTTFIQNLSEYQRNNASNLTFIRSNILSGGGWNVVYEYKVNTNLLPTFIKKQQVHLLIENNTVKKYMIAQISENKQ